MVDHYAVGVAALGGDAVLTPVPVIVGEDATVAVLVIAQLAQVAGSARPDEAPAHQQQSTAGTPAGNDCAQDAQHMQGCHFQL